jgi:hypothetical protein
VFVVIGVLALVLFVLLCPLNRIVLWIIISPLFAHIMLVKLGDLIPAVTIDRLFLFAVLLWYLAGTREDNLVITEDRGTLETFMLIFIVVFTIQIYTFYRPKDATRNWITFFEGFVMPFLMFFLAKYHVKDWSDANKLLSALVVSGCIVALIGIYEQITWHDLIPYQPEGYSRVQGLRHDESFVRSNGPYMTPEAFGGTLAMIWFVCLFKLRRLRLIAEDSTRDRIWLLVAMVTLTGGVLSCMFRSIWLGLAVGLFVHIRSFAGATKRFLLYGCLALAALIIIGVGTHGISDFVADRLLHKESLYSRFGAYKIAWHAIIENPIFGVGYNNFKYYATHFNIDRQIKYDGVWAADTAHNTFIKVLAENGIIGFLPFGLLFFLVFMCIIRLFRQAKGPEAREWCAAMIGISAVYFVPWFFETTGDYPSLNNLFFLLMGITWRASEWAWNEDETRESFFWYWAVQSGLLEDTSVESVTIDSSYNSTSS